MTKNAHLFTLLLFFLIILGCDSETNQENEVALSSSEIARLQVTVMVQEAAKEKAIIKEHYLQLDQSIRDKISLREYDLFLLLEYGKLTDRLMNKLDNSNKETFSVSEFEDFENILLDSSELPEWYIAMKKNTSEKVMNAGKKTSR